MHQFYSDEIVGKAYDARLMKRIIKYLIPYKGLVAISFIMLFIVSALELVGPYLTKIAIDVYIKNKNLTGLFNIALLFLGVLIFSFIMEYIQMYIMQFIGQKIMFDMRVKIFTHLQKMDMSFFDRNPVGRLMTRVMGDVEVLNELFASGMVTIFGDIFTLLGIAIVMFILNWKLALVTLSVIPLLFYATLYFRKKARASFRNIRKRIARINAFMQENIGGMAIIQLFRQERKKFQQFKQLNKDHFQAWIETIFYFAIFFPAVEIISSLAISLIIWYGGGEILQQTLTIGALVAFIQYAQRFFYPIRDLSEKYNILQSAMAASERVFKLLDTPDVIKNPVRPVYLKDLKGEIEFNNVWFSYNEDEWVLKDISFKVEPGEKIAIVGATGAGKTSIINLLGRFYELKKGTIRIDGTDIKKMDLNFLRKNIGVVLQDVFVFSGSIEDNIRLGEKGINRIQVEQAAQFVNAHKFIQLLEHGYATEVRERGSLLSTGQRQLLAFARVLAFDPCIFVLDEATSNIDTETEILIQQALKQVMKGRTSLIIAHRLSTIKDVDRIIVLHKGRIREEGTHQQLLKQKGIYYRLYQLQYKNQNMLREAG
jgi:ATP-binding cassette subfamily B multidrug efflux pump